VYPDARNPHSHVELLAEGHEPHAVDWIWFTGGREPSVAVDISDVIDNKIKALSCHSSQVGFIDDIDALLRGWATETAERHDLAETAPLVEVFTTIKTS